MTPLTSEAGNGFSWDLHFIRFAQKDLERWHNTASFGDCKVQLFGYICFNFLGTFSSSCWVHFLRVVGHISSINLVFEVDSRLYNHMSPGPKEAYLCRPRLYIWHKILNWVSSQDILHEKLSHNSCQFLSFCTHHSCNIMVFSKRTHLTRDVGMFCHLKYWSVPPYESLLQEVCDLCRLISLVLILYFCDFV